MKRMKRVLIALLACLCIAKVEPMRGDAPQTLFGFITTDTYVAEARIRSSGGEVSGAVIFTAREGGNAGNSKAIATACAFEGGLDAAPDYALKVCSAASGEALLQNLDGSIARGEDGTLTLYVRYELPVGMKIVSLSPVGWTAAEISLR